MKLKIHHTGHAGFVFEFENKVLVCDHWNDDYFPFENSWEKLEKDNFNTELLDLLDKPDYIWCSHEHGDHFDPTYLKKIQNKNAKLIIPNFADKQFYKRILKKGFKKDNIILLDDLETLKITDSFKVKMIFEEPKFTNHSSLAINIKNFRCLHNADTTPNTDFYSKAKLQNIDLFIGQYCNPTPYPWTIEMEPPKIESEAIEMHNNSIKTHVEMCEKFGAKNTIPCAGPAIVKNFKTEKFKKANKLIYDKKYNLDLIQKELNNTKVLDINSGDLFIKEI